MNQKRIRYTLDGYLRIPADDPAVPELIETLTLDLRDGVFTLYEKDEKLNELRIPRTLRNDRLLRSCPIEDHTLGGRPFSWIKDSSKASHFIPREGQLDVVREVCSNLFSDGGSLLIAGCGCLTGDTIIGLNRGGKGFSTTLKNAFFRSQGECPEWSPRITTRIRAKVGDQVRLINVLEFVDSGFKQVFEVTTILGKILKLTVDHEVLTPEGYYSIETGLGDKIKYVAVEHDKAKFENFSKVSYRRLHWSGLHPNVHKNGISLSGKQKYCLEEHRAIIEASLNNVSFDDYRSGWINNPQIAKEKWITIDPKEYHVHHKDGDILNNSLDNLELLGAKEHWELHGYENSRNVTKGVISYEEIRSIRQLGVERVFDIRCEDPHNFIANGFVVHNCGKTVMGVEIALRMGVSTCVIVHKEFLAAQWEAAFAMLAPWVTVGRMQRDQVDTGNIFDIVIAVTQSIVNTRRDYSDDFYNSFGLIICDEVHRYGANVWQKAITKFPARYRVGLTATPERQDGLWKVITSHISNTGPTLKAASLVPDIYIVKTDVKIDQKLWYKPWLDSKLQRGSVISALSEHRGRNEAILGFILKAYSKGRKVLIISERRAQLDHFSKRLTEESIPCDDIGFYVGGMKQAKLDLSARKQVILTTYQMSKEGLDIPDLDTLIMATPQGSIEQTVGRILRRFEGKATPVVIDVHDEKFEAVVNCKDLDRTEDELFKPLTSGLFSRKRQYKKLGYKVHG